MAKFKILYTPYGLLDELDTTGSEEREVDVPGWNDTNWKDDDFYDNGLEHAVKKQHADLDLMAGEIEDWWPHKGNESFTHLGGQDDDPS